MFTKALTRETKETLEILSKQSFIKDFYLAGGSALSLWLGHRVSKDLDFFTEKKLNFQAIVKTLRGIGNLSIDIQTPYTLVGNFNGVKLSLFYYELPLISNPTYWKGIRVASPIDIGCMKLDALSSRGLKRDFIDLYFICKEFISFGKLIVKFKEKLGGRGYNFVHLAKSLGYFEDAVDTVDMLKECNWNTVKSFFSKKSIELLNTVQ